MKLSDNEKKWILCFSLVVVMITTIPYIIAYSHVSNYRFTGFLFGVEDGNSYIAKMLSGANGAWLFRSPYSAEPQNGFIAYLPYLLLGKITSSPAQHEQLVALYQIFRWLSVGWLVYWTYRFSALFFSNVFYRKITTIVSTIGGGLGWLSLLGVTEQLGFGLPLEIYSPETFGFLSVLGLPHLVAARGLLLCGFVQYLTAVSNKQRIFAGISWFAIGIFQPLMLITAWALLFVHLGLILCFDLYSYHHNHSGNPYRWRFFLRTALMMVMISSPWVIYNFLAFSLDSYLSGWQAQNILPSPPFWDYLFSFALLLPFSLVGIYRTLRSSREAEHLLLFAWILAFPFLAYMPYNMQRRLPEGIWVALSISAFLFFAHKKGVRSKKVSFFLAGLSLLTSLMIISGGIQEVLNPREPIFHSQQEVLAYQYLNEVADGGVVVASYPVSNALPAWAPVYVLVGHGPESVHFDETSLLVKQLFAGILSEAQISELINDFNVKFLFWGPEEQTMGDWSPIKTELFSLVYEDPPYFVFRVKSAQEKK